MTGNRTKRASREEIDAIKRGLCLRDKLIVDIAVDTGLRISDILSLPAELSAEMTVREQKTGKLRTVRLTPATLGEAEKYTTIEGIEGRLFDVSRSTAWRNISKQARELGLEHIGPHSFRKTFAREFFVKHGLIATQKELMHNYPSTTLLYILDEEEIINAKFEGQVQSTLRKD